MELDELKVAWVRLAQRVETTESLVFKDYKERKLDTVRRALRFLGTGQVVLSLVSIAVIVVVAPFWIEHRHVPHLLLAGLSLHLYAVITICGSVMQLLLIGRIYYTAPVVTIQRRLAELQRFRTVSTLVNGMPWWVLWVTATMVGAKRWLGVDLYAISPGWILGSIGVGIVGMAVTVWLARRFADNPPDSPALRHMADDLAGRTLWRVSRDLDEIVRFEQE